MKTIEKIEDYRSLPDDKRLEFLQSLVGTVPGLQDYNKRYVDEFLMTGEEDRGVGKSTNKDRKNMAESVIISINQSTLRTKNGQKKKKKNVVKSEKPRVVTAKRRVEDTETPAEWRSYISCDAIRSGVIRTVGATAWCVLMCIITNVIRGRGMNKINNYLFDYYHRRGVLAASVPYSTVKERTGFANSTVKRSLDRLTELGYIQKKELPHNLSTRVGAQKPQSIYVVGYKRKTDNREVWLYEKQMKEGLDIG